MDRAPVDSVAEHRMVSWLITLMRSVNATPEPQVVDRLVELDYPVWARNTLLIDTCLAVAERRLTESGGSSVFDPGVGSDEQGERVW